MLCWRQFLFLFLIQINCAPSPLTSTAIISSLPILIASLFVYAIKICAIIFLYEDLSKFDEVHSKCLHLKLKYLSVKIDRPTNLELKEFLAPD